MSFKNILPQLLEKAIFQHGDDIKPCGDKTRWEDVITDEPTHTALWYDTIDKSTHLAILKKTNKDIDVVEKSEYFV